MSQEIQSADTNGGDVDNDSVVLQHSGRVLSHSRSGRSFSMVTRMSLGDKGQQIPSVVTRQSFKS